ncbi:MAG TPA: flagellar basal-body MS-ring/collar protein FliF [Acetobacteraceae bacterium]|nr:flagellar basal-body MS-ring/collar protein FliF [Acetobacteraceae bacterium]
MTLDYAKTVFRRLLERIKNIPLPLGLGMATILVALMLLAVIGMSGPPYQVLYEGLSPQQGGEVIAELQKLGIPYQLDRAGTIIKVPLADLGRARLELASSGTPTQNMSKAWETLENAPMTASEASLQALQLEAEQNSLEDSIKSVTGAQDAQVLIALPQDTPFLATQPKPKASVVLVGAPEGDESLGATVAHLVAGAVPGLALEDVVVATSGGKILYPVSSTYEAAQQLAIQQDVEAVQQLKIRSLLAPIVGPDNFRATVSADIEFGHTTLTSVSYGPHAYPASVDVEQTRRTGNQTLPIGIPGALSNQPPGSTTAPLNPATAPGAAGRPAPPTTAAGSNQQTAAASSEQQVPVNTSRHSQTQYDVDQTSTEDHPASWRVKAISISIVVNRAALQAIDIGRLKTLVAGTSTVPIDTLAVIPAKFINSGTPSKAQLGSNLRSGLKASLLLIAAIAVLAGLLSPLRRWLLHLIAQPQRVIKEAEKHPEEDTYAQTRALLGHSVDRVRLTVQSEPLVVVKTLQKWLEQT